MAVAEGELGPVAAGQHQPVGTRSPRSSASPRSPPFAGRAWAPRSPAALVEDALEHGAELIFLSAGSDEIAHVYRRIGFRRVATACIVG